MINDIHTDVDDYLKVIPVKDRTVCFQQAKSQILQNLVKIRSSVNVHE